MLTCALLGDLCCAVHAGINSFFAGLAGSLPNTTFAQNNGVLALTRCASRSAGYSCGIWLFLFGVLAKVPCSLHASGMYGQRPHNFSHTQMFACVILILTECNRACSLHTLGSQGLLLLTDAVCCQICLGTTSLILSFFFENDFRISTMLCQQPQAEGQFTHASTL